MVVEVASGLNTSMHIPCNRVLNAWFDTDHAYGADPNLASLCILAVGLLNLEFNTTLYLGVRERCF